MGGGQWKPEVSPADGWYNKLDLLLFAAAGANRVEMLRRSNAGDCDLILMDIQMPNMDGYGAARAIRTMKDPAKSAIRLKELLDRDLEL